MEAKLIPFYNLLVLFKILTLCFNITAAFSSGNGSFNSTVVPPILLAAEKEEAKSVLSLFLKKQGLSKVVVAKTIAKSDVFINHLVSRIHSVHKSRYLVGSMAVCTGCKCFHFQLCFFPANQNLLAIQEESSQLLRSGIPLFHILNLFSWSTETILLM